MEKSTDWIHVYSACKKVRFYLPVRKHQNALHEAYAIMHAWVFHKISGEKAMENLRIAVSRFHLFTEKISNKKNQRNCSKTYFRDWIIR